MARVKPKYLIILIAAVVISAAILSVVILQPPVTGVQGRSVAVTWGLLAEIVYRLGGGEIEVIQLLPPGAEVHHWEPTPEVVRSAAMSRLLIWTVEGLDDWAVEVAASTGVRGLKAAHGVQLLELEEHEHDHRHGMYDVHFWLNPLNVKKVVENVASELSSRFPELAPTIRKNADEMLSELDQLHAELSSKLAPYSGRIFVTQHNAFRYLAEAYGLEVVWVLGHEEEEPSPAHLQEVIEVLSKVCVIYAEDGYVTRIVESLSRDHGVKIAMLYTGEGLTLGEVRQGKGYVQLMRMNVEALLEGFKCG